MDHLNERDIRDLELRDLKKERQTSKNLPVILAHVDVPWEVGAYVGQPFASISKPLEETLSSLSPSWYVLNPVHI
jgi:hypothetical protein